MKATSQSPGTVSRILWHFTGGPLWDDHEHHQKSRRKPAARAFENLKSILKTRELRLGSYREVIRVRFEQRRRYNRDTRKAEIQRNVVEELASSPVCCLADIPIIHLGYLARRYGKFAIGFHRDSVVRHGFNPVFYALDNSMSVLALNKGLGQLREVNAELIKVAADLVKDSVDKFVEAHELPTTPGLRFLGDIGEFADDLESSVAAARERFTDFLGLVKTFTAEEFGTIYCEREWRSLRDFHFSNDDVAMVVLPRKIGRTAYFAPFCSSELGALGLPATLPVVPWEDLLEH